MRKNNRNKKILATSAESVVGMIYGDIKLKERVINPIPTGLFVLASIVFDTGVGIASLITGKIYIAIMELGLIVTLGVFSWVILAPQLKRWHENQKLRKSLRTNPKLCEEMCSVIELDMKSDDKLNEIIEKLKKGWGEDAK